MRSSTAILLPSLVLGAAADVLFREKDSSSGISGRLVEQGVFFSPYNGPTGFTPSGLLPESKKLAPSP
jgi:hypothetical protein